MPTRSAFLPWLALLASLLLVGAVVVQLAAPEPPLIDSPMASGTALAQLLPREIAGVEGRDMPIATTEEMKRAVDELLSFDDAVSRVYELPDLRVSLFVAWWRPGKASPRLVAAHTPDVCWPANGWIRNATLEPPRQDLDDLLAATGLPGAEWRVFETGAVREYVVFWHRVGKEIQSNESEYTPPWWAPLAEMWRDGLNLRKEQLFVRISSDRPLAEMWLRPELAPLKQALVQLGLQRPAAPGEGG